MRSGKDVAAQAIIEERDIMHSRAFHNINERQFYDIRRYSFADALKQEVNAAASAVGGMANLLTMQSNRFAMGKGYYVDFPMWVQYDPDAPMDDPMCPLGKQRTLLQFWGGDFRRKQDPEYWIKQVAKQIEEDNPQIAIITDLRYLNEFQFCMEYGETIKVIRPGLPQGSHASETELDSIPDSKWSKVLYNDGTLEEFRIKAVEAFDDLLLNFP
jgi:hypothetical protein